MLKKRVLKRLLPLLFSFCFVFSGFLSVNAFAYTSYDTIPLNVSNVRLSINDGSWYQYFANVSDNNVYSFSNTKYSNVSSFNFQIHGSDYSPWVIPVDTDVFDYFFVCSVYSNLYSITDFTFFPTSLGIDYKSHSNVSISFDLDDISYYHLDTENTKGFSASCKINFDNGSSIWGVAFSGLGTLPSNLHYEAMIIALPKGLTSGDANQAIVNAINNQTNQLSSDIGQAADDVQQSIEDQYSGDPEEEFSVEDVITQHNEKMGVLSFGSDVMLQFLDMFQSANVGTAELTLPGFNITVENVEYSVWPDYSFNFDQLNEWVPALMSVIRVMLPAFVWLMVLRYCIKVFEDNFLAK